MTSASRWAKAVASRLTRAAAPPMLRSASAAPPPVNRSLTAAIRASSSALKKALRTSMRSPGGSGVMSSRTSA